MKWLEKILYHDFLYIETSVHFDETFVLLRCSKCGIIHYYSINEDYIKYPMYDSKYCFGLTTKYD